MKKSCRKRFLYASINYDITLLDEPRQGSLLYLFWDQKTHFKHYCARYIVLVYGISHLIVPWNNRDASCASYLFLSDSRKIKKYKFENLNSIEPPQAIIMKKYNMRDIGFHYMVDNLSFWFGKLYLCIYQILRMADIF